MFAHVQELLRSSNTHKPAWAYFDALWYLSHHPAAQMHCQDNTKKALPYYLESGVKLGHSPNPFFDEQFYLSQNPDVIKLIVEQKFRSGFDHFCRKGHMSKSPHWLFNYQLYQLHSDLSPDNLVQHGFHDLYDHYLKKGQFERRTAHELFDANFYQFHAIKFGISATDIQSQGPFAHYIYHLQSKLREPRASLFFEPHWYLDNNEGVREDIAIGRTASAIEHYLSKKTRGMWDPLPQFSESYYLKNNQDVAKAVAQKHFSSGYQHFLLFGTKHKDGRELRRPTKNIDLAYYYDMNSRVRDDIEAGLANNAFSHLRLFGLQEGIPYAPSASEDVTSEGATKQLFIERARTNFASFGNTTQKLDFTLKEKPQLSVIMIAHDKIELTILALSSLRDNYAEPIELILIDNASLDQTRFIERYVSGATIFHLEENIGFLQAANLGLDHATSPAVLYLNNDIELGHGAIARALVRLNSAKDIGAVGGKIIRTHGLLQEAGSIVWKDGTSTGYMRDASPLAAETNFVREVDFCSGVFLLCRQDVLTKLGGFDKRLSPAYYEDTDICLRMKRIGFRTLYDPAVLINHLEFGSVTHSDFAMMQMKKSWDIFKVIHSDYLAARYENTPETAVFARTVDNGRKRVLFFEDTIPLRRLGSGYVRSNDILHALTAAGYDVTVFPVNGSSQDLTSILANLPEGVEAMHEHDLSKLPSFLKERPNFYDLIWVSRTHNLGRIMPTLNEAGISHKDIPYILDTEAIVANRDAARALHEGPKNFNFQDALHEEFADAGTCRQVLAVNRSEADLLHTLKMPHVSVVGTTREVDLTSKPFKQRTGLLFVAGIHQPDSPNLDSLKWYTDKILPALAREMDEVPILHVVGYTGVDVSLSAFSRNKHIKLHGAATDLRPYYNDCRVFIAPTRFAAGTPYKVYETASYGLPCVATELLAAQLGWKTNIDLLTAPSNDPKRFAAQITLLYRTEALWMKLRNHAAARLQRENTKEVFEDSVATVMSLALRPPLPLHCSPPMLKHG